MKRRNKKSRGFIKFFVALALLAAIIMLGYKIYGVSYEKYQINKKVTTLDAVMAELSQKSEDLKALVGRLEDKNYIEKEARKKLNFQKPGEQPVIITKKGAGANNGSAVKNSQSSDKNNQEESNIKLWYNTFFW
ncbi:MAG TPA: septum formation initiator family protein [Candidatus Paceibacterota bacterium]